MEYEKLPDWARTTKQSQQIIARAERLHKIQVVLTVVVLIACFLAAGYSDHQALALGLIH